MKLHQALRVSEAGGGTPLCIAFSGAGGKTTAMFTLARELKPPLLVTATTHLHLDQLRLADTHHIAAKPEDLKEMEGSLHGLTLVTGPFEGERTRGVNSDVFLRLYEISQNHALPLLVEADGSRQHPLKAPAPHEPVIPPQAGTVVVVSGLSGLGRPLGEDWVHRPQVFGEMAGLGQGEIVTAQALGRVLLHPQGGLKGIPLAARRVALLNQADTEILQGKGRQLAGILLGAGPDPLSSFAAVIIGSLGSQGSGGAQVHAVHEPVAGIVLAAGQARRFGQPKQLLEWQGRTLVRCAAESALQAGLSPVSVVTGAYEGEVRAALAELPVQIVHNPAWESGQAGSVQAGLAALGLPGAAVFLLADQPGVTPELLRSLVERHAASLCPILAPLVEDQRSNPVLFDRVTFPELMALRGDVGGRAIFPKYTLEYLPWHDPLLQLDIDTPEDWARLQEDGA